MAVLQDGVQLVVGISDAKVSRDPTVTIITHSLGSCIGVTMYDPQTRVGGLLHFQLPAGSMDPQRAKDKPFMFADTGVAALLAHLLAHGGEKRRIKVKLAGGAKMLQQGSTFDIGRRNHAAVRKELWKLGLFLEAEDCGGDMPRTMALRLVDGSVQLRKRGEAFDL